MARYTGASCKKCRREGQKLFLKGERCNTGKCAIERRAYAPGQHGKNKTKLSEYGLQLRAKQKTKVYYGVSEAQFVKYYEEAFRREGVTSDILFGLLETRLDNVCYRLGLGSSRRESRQLVGYEMVTVNGKKVNIPSYQLRVGDVVAIRDEKKDNTTVKAMIEKIQAKNVPAWLEVDKEKLTAKVIRIPARADVDLEVAENLIIELYSKN